MRKLMVVTVLALILASAPALAQTPVADSDDLVVSDESELEAVQVVGDTETTQPVEEPVQEPAATDPVVAPPAAPPAALPASVPAAPAQEPPRRR